MSTKKFNLSSRLTALVVFLIASATYLLTIEPTASFWDCGEFIASSVKLEVGHPPGNPVFQLFAKFFTLFFSASKAAVAVNIMSALCSALTILLLFLTIAFLAKRIVKPAEDGTYTISQTIAILGSSAVGALAYCFSDTFWFSAVEGEVYAMSSLFTALVFWAMIKWYEQADKPYANRWIVLISFLMGLSIGIHLLNLLTIPALVFLFYYKKREDGEYKVWEHIVILLISAVIVAIILFGIIPYLPKTAAAFDLFFVNVLGLPFNTGALFFMLLLFALCFWGLFWTLKRGKYFANTVILCFTVIIIGFSVFSIVIIRSSVKPPTNEYQPDNPYTLVRYLSREQYGTTPLIYGQYFDADYELKEDTYWTPLGDKYIKAKTPPAVEYKQKDKMLFPRMWSNSSSSHIEFYETYLDNKGRTASTSKHRKPTFWENLKFFNDYQMNWMYWRYFMWNFAGRQNDIHSPSPGEPFIGNWESGIGFLDKWRLGDQSEAPPYLKNNKGKNHYYMLPLLLGILGIVFQFNRDKRGTWITFLLFFMTGIAIVIYLNQPPFQVRERDYAYAGSFYAFSMWIGLGMLGIYAAIKKLLKNPSEKVKIPVVSAITLVCLGVPALMAAENWDDHDRSNRYTAVEIAKNYLNSVGPNGILITHGDNDTFPLWYAQEVESIRTDVRICNTSLLGTDWHIDQMKYAVNESAPLDITVGQEQYLYGTNDFVPIYEESEESVPMLLSDVMAVFKDPTESLQYGTMTMSFICSRKLIMPVNKENVLKYGILPEKYADLIPEYIELVIPSSKNYITKTELFMLDLLSNYQWDRPLNMLSRGGEIQIGIKDYLMYEGFSYKFVPIKNRTNAYQNGFVDSEDLYHKVKNVYTWEAFSRTDYYVDYHHFYTFCGVMSQRGVFVDVAEALIDDGENEKAIEILDMCQECVPEESYPLDISYLGLTNEYMVASMVELYYTAGAKDKAEELMKRFYPALLESGHFYIQKFPYTEDEFKQIKSYMEHLIALAQYYDNSDLAMTIINEFNSLLD